MKNQVSILVLLATILPSMVSSRNCQITDPFYVHVVNKLPNPPLEIHCASGNNELGYHTVTTNYDFNWDFCDSYLGNTLFFCHLWWDGKNVAFDVFKRQIKDQCVLGICYWEARSDGIYFAGGNEPRTFYKKYDWVTGSKSDAAAESLRRCIIGRMLSI